MDPLLVPRLLAVEDDEEVLQLGDGERLPADLAGVVLLEHEGLVLRVTVLRPEEAQHQGALLALHLPHPDAAQGLLVGDGVRRGLVAPLVERVLVGVVGHTELGEDLADDVPGRGVRGHVQSLHRAGGQVERGQGRSVRAQGGGRALGRDDVVDGRGAGAGDDVDRPLEIQLDPDEASANEL